MATDFGSCTYEGKDYILTDQAFLSNRLFPGWWGDAQEGEHYTAEYHATATDAEGYNYLVYWQFDAVKGAEPEDESNYPWDDAHISRVVMQ